MFLLWLTHLPAWGCVKSRKALDSSALNALGQSRRSERGLITSGLPRQADIFRCRRHVSNVPDSEVVVASDTPPRLWLPRECRALTQNKWPRRTESAAWVPLSVGHDSAHFAQSRDGRSRPNLGRPTDSIPGYPLSKPRLLAFLA